MWALIGNPQQLAEYVMNSLNTLQKKKKIEREKEKERRMFDDQ